MNISTVYVTQIPRTTVATNTTVPKYIGVYIYSSFLMFVLAIICVLICIYCRRSTVYLHYRPESPQVPAPPIVPMMILEETVRHPIVEQNPVVAWNAPMPGRQRMSLRDLPQRLPPSQRATHGRGRGRAVETSRV